MTRVVAPSRLHFGLLSLPGNEAGYWPGIDGQPGLPRRLFGGVGLMIDKPGIAVRVARAQTWSASGPLAERALRFARQFVSSLPSAEQRPWNVVVESTPPEHTGLGVGTQLGLSVAKALAVEIGHADWPATKLARLIGRGERSAIGIHGFDHGGFIVEAGKLAGEAIAPLVGRQEFPDDWTTIAVTLDHKSEWHGSREREALAQLKPPATEVDALYRILLTGVLPALSADDRECFGEAIYEYNARVGDLFAPVQGGRYATASVADCVAALRRRGIKGVGQSSWGPTVFAFVDADFDIREIFPNYPAVTTFASRGVIVERS